MLLNLCRDSPTFEDNFLSLDSLDSYSTDMEAMSVATDEATATEGLVNGSDQLSLQQMHEKQLQQDSDSPKKKRIRKTRAKVKSPEVIQKLKTSRRQRANDRERNRMHGLNEALEVLRTTLPNATDAKMTKIETLRYACNYISALAASLKLLEQTKDRNDMPNELPNPEDYAFMANFHFDSESNQSTRESLTSPLVSMTRSGCGIPDDYVETPQPLEPNRQHHHSRVVYTPPDQEQLAADLCPMATHTVTHSENLHFLEQSLHQQLNNQYNNFKQEQELNRNHNSPLHYVFSSQNKHLSTEAAIEALLSSADSRGDLAYNNSFSTGNQSVTDLHIAYMTPPTSPENKQLCNALQQQQQQQPRQQQSVSLPTAATAASLPLTNSFLQPQQQQQQQKLIDQQIHKLQMFSTIMSANSQFSSSLSILPPSSLPSSAHSLFQGQFL
ncbi:hypothetical protein BsWGS_20989 [Bradybaena similaris]